MIYPSLEWIGQKSYQSLSNQDNLHKIQKIIRHQPYNTHYQSEKTDKTRMLSHTTTSTTNTLPPTRRCGERTRPTNWIRTPRRLETAEEDCFVSPVVITVKKHKSLEIILDARNLKESSIKEATIAKHGRTIKPNLHRAVKKWPRPDLHIGDRSRLRLWSEETGTGNQETLHICNNGRENQRLLPLPKEILRTSRHTDHLSRENRPNTDTKRQYG